jgi:hypothetical protein
MVQSGWRNRIDKYGGWSHFQSRIGSNSFGAKVAQHFCKVDPSLLTHLFDPDLEVISQHDTDKMKEFLRPQISI